VSKLSDQFNLDSKLETFKLIRSLYGERAKAVEMAERQERGRDMIRSFIREQQRIERVKAVQQLQGKLNSKRNQLK